ncbi:MAG: GDP-L-fucose synthase [Desulfobulbaceae bacterium]|jgi:GDP-L-fucose synthase|nr:GDP-L-fucose synthase [Desulfobulbaceae bacterium]
MTVEIQPIHNTENKIFVAGHRGMVGAAIVRQLQQAGFGNIVTRTHHHLDLTNQRATREFFQDEGIDQVVLAAAKVGGIQANNSYPAEFIYQNIQIAANVIHEAWQAGVRHILFLGSSCIYPKFAPQPIHEEDLLTGALEPTNEPYAIAKIAGIKLCEAYNRQYGVHFRSVMPTNLYGPGDSYDLTNSHVIPAMIRKFHLARLATEENWAAIRHNARIYGDIPEDVRLALDLDEQLRPINNKKPKAPLWGTGRPRREFLHVDDMARACVYVMGLTACHFTAPAPSFLNVGSGIDQSIGETAALIAELMGFSGEIVFDATKPDGTPQKLMDSSRLRQLGWRPRYDLRDGLRHAIDDYLARLD